MPVNTLNGNDLLPVSAGIPGQTGVENNEVTVDDFQAIPRLLVPAVQFLTGATADVSLFYTATDWN
jgi:hypothetical protein